jgi:hypothetical protein
MAMSASSMKDKIKGYIQALGTMETSNPDQAKAFSDMMLVAMCQGIIDEIEANAEVVYPDAATDLGGNLDPGHSHTLATFIGGTKGTIK